MVERGLCCHLAYQNEINVDYQNSQNTISHSVHCNILLSPELSSRYGVLLTRNYLFEKNIKEHLRKAWNVLTYITS